MLYGQNTRTIIIIIIIVVVFIATFPQNTLVSRLLVQYKKRTIVFLLWVYDARYFKEYRI